MFVSKKTIKQQIEKFKKSFFQSPNLPFNNFLADDDIADIIEHTSHKRTAVFTPLITLKAFIFQALGDDGSCKQAVALPVCWRIEYAMGNQPTALIRGLIVRLVNVCHWHR